MTKNFNYLAHLQMLRQKAEMLQPATAEEVIPDLDQMILNLKGGDSSVSAEERAANIDANNKQLHDLLMRHRTGKDPEATAEVIQLRTIKLKNLLFARSNVLQFFDTVTLLPNEIPEFENTTVARMIVSYIGQDGQAKKTQANKARARVQIEMNLLSTEEYEYPLKDMYKGAVADEAKALVDMTWEMDRKLEALAWPYLFGQIGAFTLTGPSQLRTYFLHSGVNVKNIPTTNLLIARGTMTTSSPFRKECFDAILEYAAAWGDAWPDGMLSPVAVYVPSSEAMGFLSQVTMTTQSNVLSDQVMSLGSVFEYGGRKWTIIPDATLDPDLGLAYVRMNKPAGTLFTKPFMDDIFEDDSIAMRKQNKGSISMTKAIGWGLPNTARINVAAVRYHDAR